MTWGWIRPVVLLPAEADSWGVDRRRDVLLHELAHVRRLDCLTQAIARAACAVYWFHPLAWVAARRMRIERERACDDVVLLAGARASDYAGHLLEIARGLRVPRAAALAALAMARPSQLEGRLMAILDPARRRRGPGRGVAAIALLAASLVLVPAGDAAPRRTGVRHRGPRSPSRSPTIRRAADPAARMTVTGRVLDPSGKPVPDAAVMVIVRSKYANRPLLERAASGAMTAHEGRCDGSGRFRIELPRTTSARQYGLTVTAMAPGYGIGWTELDPDADPPVADVALRPELIVRGRMFDVKGQPAPGVALRIELMIPVVRGTISMPIARPDFDELHRRDFARLARPGDQRRPGPIHPARAEPRPALPAPHRRPAIRDPAHHAPDRGKRRRPATACLASPRSRSIPAPIRSRSRSPCNRPGRSSGASPMPTPAGPSPMPWSHRARPIPRPTPRDGSASPRRPAARRSLRGPSPVPRRRAVPDGLQAGRMAQGGGRAVGRHGPAPGRGRPRQDHRGGHGPARRGSGRARHVRRRLAEVLRRVSSVPAVTGPDGTYRVAAPPGPGYLVVQGPDDDYVLREFGGDGAMYAAAARPATGSTRTPIAPST